MFESAVANRVREAADLDWKSVLISAEEIPAGAARQKALEDRRKEFAKDVAAMANTQGGLIVYGIREVNEEADDTARVPTGERERQRLRSWANGLIRPWLSELTIEAFPAPGEESLGILVVSVPASPDAPHVIGERSEMGVPYRDGSHTAWMSEYQIERAYRDRFARQASQDAALATQLIEVREHLDLSRGAWLVVATRPMTAPTQLGNSAAGKDTVRQTMEAALQLAGQVHSTDGGRYRMLQELGSYPVNNPRVGLRRWVLADTTLGEAGALSTGVHVELWHDSAATVAFGLEGFLPPPDQKADYHRVAIPFIGSALVESVALAVSHARARGYSGELGIAAELVRDDDMPFGGLDFVTLGSMRGGTLRTGMLSLVQGSRLLRTPTRVEVAVGADADVPRVRQAAKQLDSDLVHQFGIPQGSVPAE